MPGTAGGAVRKTAPETQEGRVNATRATSPPGAGSQDGDDPHVEDRVGHVRAEGGVLREGAARRLDVGAREEGPAEEEGQHLREGRARVLHARGRAGEATAPRLRFGGVARAAVAPGAE